MTAGDGPSGEPSETATKRPRTRRSAATGGSTAPRSAAPKAAVPKAEVPKAEAPKPAKSAAATAPAESAPATKRSRAKGSGGKAPAAKTGATAKPTRTKGSAARPAPVASAAEPAVAAPSPPFELYFVRHADAGDPAEWSGDDADRPLSKKGRRQARRLAASLDDLKIRPDVLLTSPKLRADDTAKALSRRLRVPVTAESRLAGELDGQGLEWLLGQVDGAAGRVMLVGHDPDFSQLVSWLVGGPVAMRKGALARVDLPGRTVAPGLGSLRWLLPPDAIPG